MIVERVGGWAERILHAKDMSGLGVKPGDSEGALTVLGYREKHFQRSFSLNSEKILRNTAALPHPGISSSKIEVPSLEVS